MGNGRRRRRWAFRTGEERRAGRINWLGDRKEWRDTKHGFFLQQHTVQTGWLECSWEITVKCGHLFWSKHTVWQVFFKKNKQESLPCLSMLVASLVGGVLATFFSSLLLLSSSSYPRPFGRPEAQPTNQHSRQKNRRREGKLSRNSPNKLIGKKIRSSEKSAKEKIYYVSKTIM